MSYQFSTAMHSRKICFIMVATGLVAVTMPTKTDASKKGVKPFEEIQKEFELFFSDCAASELSKSELSALLLPVKLKLIKARSIVWGLKWGSVILMIFLAYYSEFLSWNLSAVGRLTLAKLRPIWNWEELHQARCLIAKRIEEQKVEESVASDDFSKKDCVLCETIDKIHRISNVSYTQIYEKYLLRGRPVIISDSHDIWPNDFNFASYLLSLKGLIHSEPCNLQSNLMLEEFTDMKVLLQLVEQNIDTEIDEWFVHFRNCDFEAIKAVRSVATKPYYYSPHLEPHYASWLLMSQNYRNSELKELVFMEFVIVQQLIGVLDIVLEPKDACTDMCGKHRMQLEDGEALVYFSKLWNFKYIPSDRDLSVTVVTETHLL